MMGDGALMFATRTGELSFRTLCRLVW
ncbi:protein of unknown function (plasmid) [Shinella sp. WSC3-e]|nr:protein of unknown function [Shinella sp. WSC3-e]